MPEAFDATPLSGSWGASVLSGDEREALQSVTGTVRTLDAHQDIVREGDRPSASCLVLEGFAYRYKLTEAGKRQILSITSPAKSPTFRACISTYGPQLGHAGPEQVGVPLA